MSNYRAYLSESDLLMDAVLVVMGGVRPIDVQMSDRLTIECPGERRIDVLVLERGDGTMVIAIADGRSVALRMTTDGQFPRLALSAGFTRQCWVVV